MTKLYKYILLLKENPKYNDLRFNNDGRVYYVYRVTQLDTNEYYYGSRISRIDSIEKDFWNYCTTSKRKKLIMENPSNYKVKIVKTFTNSDDMYIYEGFLHNFFNARSHVKFWNGVNQNINGFNPSGYIPAKDKHGNKFHVSVDDERLTSGELCHTSKGIACVRDEDGICFGVPIDDSRYVSGELQGINKGKKVVRDKNGNNLSVNIDNKMYDSVNKGKIVVKDKEGVCSSVKIDDQRYISGELEQISTGYVVTYDVIENTFVKVLKEVYHNDRRYVGTTKNTRLWVINNVSYKNSTINDLGISTHKALSYLKEYMVNIEEYRKHIYAIVTDEPLKILKQNLTKSTDLISMFDIEENKRVRIPKEEMINKKYIDLACRKFYKDVSSNTLYRNIDLADAKIDMRKAKKIFTEISRDEYVKEYLKA